MVTGRILPSKLTRGLERQRFCNQNALNIRHAIAGRLSSQRDHETGSDRADKRWPRNMHQCLRYGQYLVVPDIRSLYKKPITAHCLTQVKASGNSYLKVKLTGHAVYTQQFTSIHEKLDHGSTSTSCDVGLTVSSCHYKSLQRCPAENCTETTFLVNLDCGVHVDRSTTSTTYPDTLTTFELFKLAT